MTVPMGNDLIRSLMRDRVARAVGKPHLACEDAGHFLQEDERETSHAGSTPSLPTAHECFGAPFRSQRAVDERPIRNLRVTEGPTHRGRLGAGSGHGTSYEDRLVRTEALGVGMEPGLLAGMGGDRGIRRARTGPEERSPPAPSRPRDPGDGGGVPGGRSSHW